MIHTRKTAAPSLAPLALTAALGLLSVVPAAAQNYSLQLLGVLPGGTSSQALGLSGNGQVAGYSDTGSTNQATMSNGGAFTGLNLPASVFSLGTSINNSGQVTGEAQLYSPPGQSSVTEAYVYSNGSTTYLRSLGGNFSQGNAINNSGQVVGSSETAVNSTHAFLYSGGVVTDLDPAIGGYDSTTAYGISDNGLITGTVYGSYTFVYDSKSGAVTFLPSLTDPDPTGGASITGFAINNSGQVTGSSISSNNEAHAFLFSNGVLTDLTPNLSNNTTSEGLSINSKGQIVGDVTPGGVFVNPYAALFSDGEVTDLNTAVVNPMGFDLFRATGINDNGQISGYGFTTGNPGHIEGYLLTPIAAAPEPSAWLALGIGLLGLGALAAKARRYQAQNTV